MNVKLSVQSLNNLLSMYYFISIVETDRDQDNADLQQVTHLECFIHLFTMQNNY